MDLQVPVQKEDAKVVAPKSQARYARLLSKRPTHGQQGTSLQAESSKDGHGATQVGQARNERLRILDQD